MKLIYTIDHRYKRKPVTAHTEHGTPVKTHLCECKYIRGEYAPNYPVPAIRTEVDWYCVPNVIYITEITEGVDNGRYWVSHDNVRGFDSLGSY